MTIKDEMVLIVAMTKDLKDSVLGFEKRAKAQLDKGITYKPRMGYGALGDELTQGETSYAIERKIVTIREHLNTLRKRIVYYNGSREDTSNAD